MPFILSFSSLVWASRDAVLMSITDLNTHSSSHALVMWSILNFSQTLSHISTYMHSFQDIYLHTHVLRSGGDQRASVVCYQWHWRHIPIAVLVIFFTPKDLFIFSLLCLLSKPYVYLLTHRELMDFFSNCNICIFV